MSIYLSSENDNACQNQMIFFLLKTVVDELEDKQFCNNLKAI